jgi:hypothetical protein
LSRSNFAHFKHDAFILQLLEDLYGVGITLYVQKETLSGAAF